MKAHGLRSESDKEKALRLEHEEMVGVPWCYRMEYKKPKRFRQKKKKKKPRKTGRSCGNCRHFVRFKNDENSTGLCEKKDSRTWVESGKNCKKFRKKPYERKKFKHEVVLRKGA